MSDSPARAYLILLLMPLFFAMNPVIGRAVVDTVPPWTLAFLRWFLASVILLSIARASIRAHAGALRAGAGTVLVLGFLGMWVCGGLLYVALQQTTATNTTLIYAGAPVIVVLLDALLSRKPLRPLQAVGVAMGIAGVAAIVLRGNPGTLLSLRLNPGDLWAAIAATAWAVYSLVLQRKAIQAVPTLVSFFAIAAAGTFWLLPFAAWETWREASIPTAPSAWISVLTLAVFPSVLAFSAYQYGVKAVGPSVTSVFLYLMPVYGIALAITFLGEAFHWYHALGLGLVVGGIALATRSEMMDTMSGTEMRGG